jgi:hypothetical protein
VVSCAPEGFDVALTQCPDCGGKLSTEAASCPHCGRPTASVLTETETAPQQQPPSKQRRKSREPLIWLMVSGVAFFTCFYATLRDGNKTSSPARTSTASMTPAQLLAVGDGRQRDDAEMAAAFARLDAACPESGMAVADIATNFKRLAGEQGHDYPMIYLMNHLSKVQEGTGSAITCSEAAATTLVLLKR